MSYIPDCRPKYEKDCAIHYTFAPKEPIDEKEINPYWYGLVKGEDKEFLRGFDYAVTMCLCNWFDNLDVCDEELERIGIVVDDIDVDVVNGAYEGLENIYLNNMDDRANKCLEEYSDEELEKMNKSTLAMLTIKSIVLDYIERERDMLVTSMIDDMDDEEHEKAMEEAGKE
jgi:hypothetical protein